MKRSEALKPLSREHHHALVTAKRLVDLQSTPEQLLLYWQQQRTALKEELEHHFIKEEEGFSTLLEGELQQRFLEDHQRIRNYLLSEDIEQIIAFALCLKAHVRFEERELFTWLEKHHSKALATAFLAG